MKELHIAAYNGDPEGVASSLARGDDINEIDESGFTPLHWSAFRGLVGTQLEVTDLLLKARSNPNAITAKSGDSVLILACTAGNVDQIKLLIENGADVNQIANHITPLMSAAHAGDVTVVELLLRSGADPNIKANGKTALDYANYYGHDDIVELLQEKVQPEKCT